MTILEVLITTFGLANLVALWVAIDYLRRILDAMHTRSARENTRRQWATLKRS